MFALDNPLSVALLARPQTSTQLFPSLILLWLFGLHSPLRVGAPTGWLHEPRYTCAAASVATSLAIDKTTAPPSPILCFVLLGANWFQAAFFFQSGLREGVDLWQSSAALAPRGIVGYASVYSASFTGSTAEALAKQSFSSAGWTTVIDLH